MSRARLVITAVVLEGRSQAEVARTYGVSEGWVSKLLARYREEGEAAFEPRSRRPRTSPNATSRDVVEQILELRKDLSDRGLDAGPKTIAWHLLHYQHLEVSLATISRILTREGFVTPQPKKRPRSSYVRFEADQPNECWQADFTHYRLAGRGSQEGRDTEILTFLDDHSRLVLHMSAHRHVTGEIVTDAFREAVQRHGIPASTLTDNGLVFTARFAGAREGATPSRPCCTSWASCRRTRGPTTRRPVGRSSASSRRSRSGWTPSGDRRRSPGSSCFSMSSSTSTTQRDRTRACARSGRPRRPTSHGRRPARVISSTIGTHGSATTSSTRRAK